MRNRHTEYSMIGSRARHVCNFSDSCFKTSLSYALVRVSPNCLSWLYHRADTDVRTSWRQIMEGPKTAYYPRLIKRHISLLKSSGQGDLHAARRDGRQRRRDEQSRGRPDRALFSERV
eukprot:6197139-Pleurochrysis_carterae.AAC.3